MIELDGRNEAPEITPGLILLRYGEQRVEVTLLCHQFIERAGFGNGSVFEGQHTVIPLQQIFVQCMGDNNAGQTT